MECAVRFADHGKIEIRYGLEICDGPRTYRLLLTHPVDSEGQIIEIPREKIKSIDQVASGRRGESPRIVER